MTFDEILAQVQALLQREQRVSYRGLKRRFALDDEYIEDLKEELIGAKRFAVDEDGRFLVWTRGTTVASSQWSVVSPQPLTPNPQPPSSYTPAHLAERIRAVAVTEGERKTITALFADLKGSTALIEGLDPEEARAIIDPALQLMMDAVHRYDGYVAQALGDGIFALFGAPLAHEDHPQRALYAALRMQEAMRRYADALRQKGYPPLLLRVGLNTGEVVLRSIHKDDLHADYVPVGHSTNVAARMEQLAAPGSIVVSAHTQRLTEGYFAFTDLGPTKIKGVEEPLHIYEVVGVGPIRTRLQVSARRGLTRFVGRQNEMEQLQRALEQAKAGHGQIVGVMGEPGLGKSRLFHEFVGATHASPLLAHGCLVLDAYSVSHGKATAYLPVIELLKSYFRLESQDEERTRREKVGGKVLMLDRSLEDTLPYLFALLGIEEQPSPLQQMDPQIRRQRTFAALKKLFLRESLNQPLVLIFEDLHWIDGETQGFLDVLSESVASAKILLLTNYRPEYRHEWGQKTYYTQLRLAPLGRAEAEEFLDVLLGAPVGARHASPLQDLKRLILDKTQGTPFFMEEIVQELVEPGVLVRDGVGADLRVGPGGAGAHTGAPLHIPPTVQGILAARIDRLTPDEKALLQQLAVIGRQFPLSLIRQVLPQPEADLYRLLASLQHKEFLYEQPAFPESEYIFKHALTQEVAYGTVLQEQKKRLHERTGHALETVYAATLSEHYSDLAHHYGRSTDTEKAITYLQLAGQQAVQRSANTEAIDHLTMALELFKIQPDTPQRARQELTLQIALGPPLMAVKGPMTEAVESTYTRARMLCEQLGASVELFPTLRGLWWAHHSQAQLSMAHSIGEQLLRLAERANDPALLLEAHHTVGATLYWQGQFARARDHLECGIPLYDRQQHRALSSLYSIDPGVSCLSRVAHAWWHLGYPEKALKRSSEALALAHDLAHAHSIVFALSVASSLHHDRREGKRSQEHAETLITLCQEHGFFHFLNMGTAYHGRALATQGQKEKGLAQMQEMLTVERATLSRARQTVVLMLLAETCVEVQQPSEGLAFLQEVFPLIQTIEANKPEFYRLKGELTLQKFNVQDSTFQVTDPQPPSLNPEVEQEAEGYFLQAIAIAQKQQAKSLELRAVMSLARLWQSQGKTAEARQMLAEIYGWFTEGFDTKDLQEAKALLEELSQT